MSYIHLDHSRIYFLLLMFPKSFLHIANNQDLPELVSNPLFLYLVEELKAQYNRNDFLAKSLAQCRADKVSLMESCEQLRQDCDIHVANIVLAQSRIDELEFDLENLFDQYNTAIEQLIEARRDLLESQPPQLRRVRRRLTFDEIIDLTTEEDSDLETEIENLSSMESE